MKFKKSKKIAKKNKPKIKYDCPSLVYIFKNSWLEISSFWRSILGILVIFGVLNYIFVANISFTPNLDSVDGTTDSSQAIEANNVFLDSFDNIALSFYNLSSGQNNLLQLMLILVASMAIIWSLRKLRGLKKIKWRQAYYEGSANIVVVVIILLLLSLTLIPSSIGAVILSAGLPLASTGLEQSIVLAVGLLLLLATAILLNIWWPAYFIGMLPGSSPIKSLRMAGSLTKKLRTKIFFRILAINIFLLFLILLFMLPLAILLKNQVQIVVYIILILAFGVANIMYFNLYRGLVDAKESKPKNSAASRSSK